MKATIDRVVVKMHGTEVDARAFATEIGAALRHALGRANVGKSIGHVRVDASPQASSGDVAQAVARKVGSP